MLFPGRRAAAHGARLQPRRRRSAGRAQPEAGAHELDATARQGKDAHDARQLMRRLARRSRRGGSRSPCCAAVAAARRQRHSARSAAAAHGGQAPAGTLTVLVRRRRRQHRPGPRRTTRSTTRSRTPTQRRCTRYKPERASTPTPDLATAMPERLRRRQDRHDQDQAGHPVQPAACNRDGHVRRRQVRDRARLPAAASRNGYAGVLLQRHRRAPRRRPRARPKRSRHPDAGRHDARLQAQAPGGVVRGRARRCPCTAPVPEAYAREYDARRPSTYGQHQVFTGPYMIESDATGNIKGSATSPASRSSWSATRTGTPRPTSGRPTSTRSLQGGHRPERRDAADPQRQQPDVNGDIAAAARRAASRSLATRRRRTSSRSRRPAATATSRSTRRSSRRSTTSTSARPSSRRSTATPAAHARRRGRSARIATHFLDPASAGLRGGRRARARARLPNTNPNGDLALAAKAYMKKAGYPSGKYTGPPVLMVGRQHVARLEHRRGRRSRAREDRLQGQDCISVPHATMYTKFCSVPKAEPNICPNVGWIKDFNDPQSMLDPTFNGKKITPREQLELAAAQRPEDQRGDGRRPRRSPTARSAPGAWGRSTRRSTGRPRRSRGSGTTTRRCTPACHGGTELSTAAAPDLTFMSVKSGATTSVTDTA